MNHLPQNIKTIRAITGLSQEGFSNLIGISRSNLAHYEVGGNPKLDLVIVFAKMFDITLDALIAEPFVKLKYEKALGQKRELLANIESFHLQLNKAS